MVTFKTKKEAEAFAAKRRKGFRTILKDVKKDNYYNTSPRRLKSREKFLREAIETTGVKKIQHKHWSKPMYEVVGK